jgi:hypothetical protein
MRLVFLLPLLLAGCLPSASNPDPRAECERAVYQDPTVRNIYTSTNMDYTRELPERYELQTAKQQAMLRCLRSKGLAPPGGVQPIQRTQ